MHACMSFWRLWLQWSSAPGLRIHYSQCQCVWYIYIVFLIPGFKGGGKQCTKTVTTCLFRAICSQFNLINRLHSPERKWQRRRVNNFVGGALILTFILDGYINTDGIAICHFNAAERKWCSSNTNRDPHWGSVTAILFLESILLILKIKRSTRFIVH